jgi:hypothetical protein
MKYLKMLGLAAVAAMALTAFLGAGSASATVLCTEANTTEDCHENGEAYNKGTEFEASLVGTATLTNTSTTTTYVTCSGGAVTGHTENTGIGPEGEHETNIKIEGTEVGWSGCSFTTDTLNPGTLEIDWIEGTDNGTVTSKEAEVTTNIFGSCVYGTGKGTDLGVLEGGETPKLVIHAVVKRLKFCLGPAEAEWNAEYHVTSPTPLYVGTS